MAKRKITDAKNPDAGYHFHIEWMAGMPKPLNFKEHGLKAVIVEYPTRG